MGVNIYSIQCLNRGYGPTKTFWRQMAQISNGYHLYLDQFNMITQMMTAICFKQVGNEALENYQQRLTDHMGGMTLAMKQMFDVMLGRKNIDEVEEENEKRYNWRDGGAAEPRHKKIKKVGGKDEEVDIGAVDLKPCRPARFQICNVDKDIPIKAFAVANGLEFKAGRGFYEWDKPEIISKKKEIVLQKKDTGEIFEGAAARHMLGLVDYNEKARMAPTKFKEYKVFIQSTSYNRKLEGGTSFLYEVDIDPK